MEESKTNSQQTSAVNGNGIHTDGNGENAEFASGGIADVADKDWNFACVCGVTGLNFDGTFRLTQMEPRVYLVIFVAHGCISSALVIPMKKLLFARHVRGQRS